MDKGNTQLKQAIMRRVYLIYAARQLVSPVALRLYALIGLVAGLASLVSVGSVLANTPRESVGALYEFSMYAVTHTEHVVQILVAAALGVFLWLVRDCIRAATHLSFFHRTA